MASNYNNPYNQFNDEREPDHHNHNNNPYYNNNLNQQNDPESQNSNSNQNMNNIPNYSGDPKYGDDFTSSYPRQEITSMMRVGFIKKVYGVLTAQLVVTALIASVGFNSDVKAYYAYNMWLFWVSFGISIGVLIPLACFPKIARKVPINYILLFIFTACEAIMISYLIAAVDDWRICLAATVLTIAVTIALTAYACTTKTDFTFLGGILFVSITIMFFSGLFGIWFGTWLRILYCCLGVLVYSIYLIFDTQLVMGKFGLQFDIDDYIIAALNIYLDIIQIFIYILSILNDSR